MQKSLIYICKIRLLNEKYPNKKQTNQSEKAETIKTYFIISR